MEEMYLFCFTEKTLNTGTLYDNLTQTNNITLTKERIYNYFKNIDGYKDLLETLEDKNEYNYDDIFDIKHVYDKEENQEKKVIINCNPKKITVRI